MNRFLRMTAVVLVAAFAFLLTGCGGSSASTSFTWFVDNIPANLDPQVATKAEDVIACENLYGGLVRRNASGELVPDLCERWEISSDGLTYTFYLKSGLTYTGTKGAATDYAITAEDFVYAFRRVFDPQTASPYAVEFSAIQNSAAVLDGTADPGTLGVSAIGELTLVFRLSERDDTFLSKLTLPGAMPCDEAFFESTRGTYGLSSTSTLSSGSFYIYNWTASGLFLRRSAASPLVNNLRLVQNTSNTDKSAAQTKSARPPWMTPPKPLPCRAWNTPTPPGPCCSTHRKARCSRLHPCGRRWPASPCRTCRCPPRGCSRR